MLLVVSALAAVGGLSTASATTGDTYTLPRSPYKVPAGVMRLWYGRYTLKSVAKGSRIYAADIFISTNHWHSLYGGGDFFGYDPDGTKEDWTNILYDFHPLARGVMEITLYGWGSPALGRLFVRRVAHGDLSGQIQLLKTDGATGKGSFGPRYSISFRKTGNRP
ncbi:MAG: hypothetical protein JOZ41_04150 [Chloroflexi bacterium]|nr:hypothetical protein [Chloroflexota bacterium]